MAAWAISAGVTGRQGFWSRVISDPVLLP